MKPRYGLVLGLALAAYAAVPAVPAFAQQPTHVTGQVVDSATQAPLADVQVSPMGMRLRVPCGIVSVPHQNDAIAVPFICACRDAELRVSA